MVYRMVGSSSKAFGLIGVLLHQANPHHGAGGGGGAGATSHWLRTLTQSLLSMGMTTDYLNEIREHMSKTLLWLGMWGCHYFFRNAPETRISAFVKNTAGDFRGDCLVFPQEHIVIYGGDEMTIAATVQMLLLRDPGTEAGAGEALGSCARRV